MSKLTAARLRTLLKYSAQSGIFRWRVRASLSIKAGDAAGTLTKDGYLRFMIGSRRYLAHRLAWFYITGSWPKQDIDHKNGIRNDNRFSNLREGSRKLNCENRRKANKNSILGLLGVSAANEKFVARIGYNGKRVHLGRFHSPELAHAAYVIAKRQYHDGCTI